MDRQDEIRQLEAALAELRRRDNMDRYVEAVRALTVVRERTRDTLESARQVKDTRGKTVVSGETVDLIARAERNMTDRLTFYTKELEASALLTDYRPAGFPEAAEPKRAGGTGDA